MNHGLREEEAACQKGSVCTSLPGQVVQLAGLCYTPSDELMLPWSYVCHERRAGAQLLVSDDKVTRISAHRTVWVARVDEIIYFGMGLRSRKLVTVATNPNVVLYLQRVAMRG